MNTIQDPVAQNLLVPFRIPGNSSSWVGELQQTVQPVIETWPIFAFDRGASLATLTGAFAQGFNSIFPLTTPSGFRNPVRILGVSMSSAVALGAGVTIRGSLTLARTGGNNQVVFTQLSDDRSFTTGDAPMFAARFDNTAAVIIRPDLDFIGYHGQSLVGVAPNLTFNVLYVPL